VDPGFQIAIYPQGKTKREFPDKGHCQSPRFRFESQVMPYQHPVCETLPLPDNQASFLVSGNEKLRWHFDPKYERPFFYPFNGPSGQSLTRMGHPGAPNHDHHRSVWFAHNSVEGENFWANNTKARIRQKMWLNYQDGEKEAVMAVRLGWFGGDGRELLEQDLVAALSPGPLDGESFLDLQSTFRATLDKVKLGSTNFGFLAVRVAKNISAHFGGGKLTNSHGMEGEPDIFGQSAQWMDYSGPVPSYKEGANPGLRTEGITYFDHPGNPRHPVHWHVRVDGWMGASFNMHEPLVLDKGKPLVLRYLLHAHNGDIDIDRARDIFAAFSNKPGYEVSPAKEIPHQQFKVTRTN
jgi:hypothetical protein